jgi:Ca2+-binding RTX toxin-like protein
MLRATVSGRSRQLRTRRLLVEKMEDRRLLALLIHDYELNGSYADEFGGPAVVPAGGTLNATNYSFAANEGLSLSNAIDSSNYSIELDFQFSTTSGYRKIIDFNDRADDEGLYNYNTDLNFYDEAEGDPGAFANDTRAQVVLTRNGITKEVVGYVNGIEQFSFTDSNDLGVFGAANNIAQFFKDDTHQTTEASAGVVDRIRIFGQPLTASQVADLFDGILPTEGLPTCDISTLNEPGAAGTAVVQEDADHPDDSVLLITGTSKNDTIIVEPRPANQTQVRVKNTGKLLGIFANSSFEHIVVYGQGGNDTIIVGSRLTQSAILFGGNGNDTLIGGGGNDQLAGEEGNDTLVGAAGNDTLCGDNGNDVLNGGVGNDTLFGEAGNDVLAGDLGDDLLLGGDNNDTLDGGVGNDRVYGQAGNDTLIGGVGNNILVGGDGNDKIIAKFGRNILIGGLGSDQLFGNANDDILIAGSTSHDEDDAALQALLNEWASSDSYDTRRNAIQNGGGANGTVLLNSDNVFDDGTIDTLIADGGRDWLFAGSRDKIKDRRSNEVITAEGI